ncbi:MAG: hypothetical protein WDN06_18785 [Asticcacaulis sp.]
MTFSAPQTQDSVYVVQSTGDATKKTTATASDGTKTTTVGAGVGTQLLKFQADTSDGARGRPGRCPGRADLQGRRHLLHAGEAEQDVLPPTIDARPRHPVRAGWIGLRAGRYRRHNIRPDRQGFAGRRPDQVRFGRQGRLPRARWGPARPRRAIRWRCRRTARSPSPAR